jgi:hypothetical protein
VSDAVSFDSPEAVAEGQLLFRDPRSGTTGPPPSDVTPWVSIGAANYSNVGRSAVGADGRYRVATKITSLPPNTLTGTIGAWVNVVDDAQVATLGDTGQTLIGAGDVTFTVSQAHVTIVPTTLTAKYPADTQVSGTVWRKVSGTWVTVRGAPVALVGNFVHATPVSGTDGVFSRVMPIRQSDVLTATLKHPFLRTILGKAPTDKVRVLVRQKSTLTWRSYSLDASSSFQFDVQLKPVRPTLSRTGRVYLERARLGSSTWSKLGYVSTDTYYGRATGGTYLVHPSWKYRLHFLGNVEMAASVSKVITLPRDDSRMVNNKVSPAKLAAGSKFTISGKAQKLSGSTFVSVGNHQEIQVFFCAKGASKWTYKGSAYTSSTGAFSKKFTAKKDGYWGAVWFTPSSKWVNAYGPDLLVDVTGTSSSAAAPPPLDGIAQAGPGVDLSTPQIRTPVAI